MVSNTVSKKHPRIKYPEKQIGLERTIDVERKKEVMFDYDDVNYSY